MQRDRESLLETRDGTRGKHYTLRDIFVDYADTMCLKVLSDSLEGLRIGPIALLELRARKIMSLPRRRGFPMLLVRQGRRVGAGVHADSHRNNFFRGSGPDALAAGKGSAVAVLEALRILGIGHGRLLQCVAVRA
jgi:hypothetical protein